MCHERNDAGGARCQQAHLNPHPAATSPLLLVPGRRIPPLTAAPSVTGRQPRTDSSHAAASSQSLGETVFGMELPGDLLAQSM